MNTQNTFTLSFDNAGGILLQTESYCHHYSWREAEQASTDVYNLIDGLDPSSWDNNEPEHRTESYDNDQDDVLEVLSNPYNRNIHSGYSEKEFFKQLFILLAYVEYDKLNPFEELPQAAVIRSMFLRDGEVQLTHPELGISLFDLCSHMGKETAGGFIFSDASWLYTTLDQKVTCGDNNEQQ